MPQVSVTFEDETLLKIDKEAEGRGISRSRVVSLAVESYLLHGPELLQKVEAMYSQIEFLKKEIVSHEQLVASQGALIDELKKDKTFLQGMIQLSLPAPARSWWSRFTGK